MVPARGPQANGNLRRGSWFTVKTLQRAGGFLQDDSGRRETERRATGFFSY
ncbi:hypothetical protein RISK_003225 [Rhodopirellula islandica]|uniref:Uncharacterized protein n=1 Tax=Rhodopirellula islandica TaxID=595434 RepID=A0A0J1BDC0_RHOIS|nr:hypothetical protein RISK_003225 [Rhodopirellula islandica]